jgi:hypothetical protein
LGFGFQLGLGQGDQGFTEAADALWGTSIGGAGDVAALVLLAHGVPPFV